MERLADSFRLAAASWAAVRANRALVLFPLVSGIASLIVTLSFVAPLVLTGYVARAAGDPGAHMLGYAALFGFYLAQYAVITYCNAALVGAALAWMRGENPTLGDGFRMAEARAGSILGYALISATVGTVLQVIREKLGILGYVVAALGGTAWTAATFLVVPTLVVEDVGPVEAIKRSGALFRQTWGQQAVGRFAIGGVAGFASLLACLVCGPIVLAGLSSGSAATVMLGVALLAVALSAISLVATTLKGIYTAALYHHATGGAGGPFDRELIAAAFAPKGP